MTSSPNIPCTLCEKPFVFNTARTLKVIDGPLCPSCFTFVLNWKNCVKENCKYKCCLALNSIYCYKHTKEEEETCQSIEKELLEPIKSSS